MTLFDLGAIIVEPEALLGVKVDIVTPGGLRPALAQRIQHSSAQVRVIGQ